MALLPFTTDDNPRSDIGSACQVVMNQSQLGFTTVGASSNAASAIIITNGFKNLAFGAKSTQAGSISLQRYLDQSGTIPQGAALTASLTANTQATLNLSDTYPYQSIIITLSNSSGSTATITNAILLLQSY